MPRQYHDSVAATANLRSKGETRSFFARFDMDVWDALEQAELQQQRSKNSLVNEAVARFLAPTSKARDTYADVIEKLGGSK